MGHDAAQAEVKILERPPKINKTKRTERSTPMQQLHEEDLPDIRGSTEHRRLVSLLEMCLPDGHQSRPILLQLLTCSQSHSNIFLW